MGWTNSLTGLATGDISPFAILDPIIGIIIGALVFFLIITLGIYIYISLALMKIAKKTNTAPSWLAWIPIGNMYLLSKIAEMHWWPVLMIPFMFIVAIVQVWTQLGFLMIPWLISFIISTVYGFIFNWKMFEKVGRPGWWILFILIPFFGILLFLIFLGIAAWGNKENSPPNQAMATV